MVQGGAAAKILGIVPGTSQPLVPEKRSRRDQEFIDRITKALPDKIRDETSPLQVIEARLTTLPEEILRGIEPWIIARQINEALGKCVAETGLPETAKHLSLLSQQVSEVTGAFHKATRELIDTQDKVADHARHAIDRMQSGIEKASGTAERAVQKLNQTFIYQYRWSIFALTSSALVVGFLLGMLSFVWMSTPAQAAQRQSAAPAIVATQPETSPPAAPKPTGKKKIQPN